MADKCVIYCRVSSEEQARKATSIPVQERECKQWVKSLGWETVHVYKDEGFSGTTLNRPAFLQMVDDARAGLFERIVVYHVDRWGRSAGDVALKEELQGLGTRFAYFMQNKPDDDGSDLGIALEEILARNAVRTNAKRVSAGQREGVRQGKISFGGRVPFGFQVEYAGKHKAYVPHPVAAPVLARIFEKYANGEETIRGVAAWLNKQKIPTPSVLNGTTSPSSSGRWHENVVYKILKNPLYTGDLVIGRHRHVRSRNGKRTSKLVTDKAAWQITPGKLPPLVDREIFEAVQQRFKENKVHKRSSDHPGNPLSNKLGRCAHCGGPISIERNHPESSNKKAKYYFLCVRFRRWKISPKETCGSAIPYDDVMERIKSLVALFLATAQREAIEKAIASFNRRSQNIAESAELKAARAVLNKLERQRSNVLNAIKNSEDDETLPTLTSTLRDVEREREEQQAVVAELEAEQRVVVEPIDPKKFLRDAREIRQRMKDGVPVPSELLRVAFSRVYLDFSKPDAPKLKKTKLKQLHAITANLKRSARDRRAAAEELATYYSIQEHPTTWGKGTSRISPIPRFEADEVPESAIPLLKSS